MKTIRFLILFTGILSMIFVSSCKKDKDTNPNNDAPAYQMQKVDIPEAMAQSNDPGAKQAVYYLNMVNAFSRYNSMMTPPKSAFVSRLKGGGGPWVYTWDVNDGEKNNYTVTLKITETSNAYHWEMTLDGLVSGIELHNFIFITAELDKDETKGSFTVYDFEEMGTVFMTMDWHQSDGNYYFTVEFPEEFLANIVVNSDGSGSIEGKDWMNGQYVLVYRAEWDASGHGEYWYYENGEVINHGSW